MRLTGGKPVLQNDYGGTTNGSDHTLCRTPCPAVRRILLARSAILSARSAESCYLPSFFGGTIGIRPCGVEIGS